MLGNFKMELEIFLEQNFPDGLSYNETAQLCLRLYCSLDNVPQKLHKECNKDDLANIFSKLAQSNFIKSEAIEAPLYGAHFHEVSDKGHWIEVIASILKKENTVDSELGEKLISCLTKSSSGTP
jgi:hypothetical protein